MADSLDTAVRLHEAGDLAGAARLYGAILQREPGNVRAQYFLGLAHLQGNDFGAAEHQFAAALRLHPEFPEALTLRGLALQSLNRLPEALDSYDAALRFAARFADAHNGRGMVLALLGKHREAVEAYEAALAARPEFAEAWSNRAGALTALGRYDDAIASSSRALGYDPNLVAGLRNRAGALQGLGRHDEALASYDQAIELAPSNAELFCARGALRLALGRVEAALADLDAALQQAPGYVDALVQRGLALSRLGRNDEALASFDAAVAREPDSLSARYNRANLNSMLGDYETVAADCAAVLAQDPEFPYARGVLLWAKLQCCDWSGLEQQRHEILARLHDGKRMLAPHQYLAFSSSPAEQLLCARIWARNECPPSPTPLWQGERYAHDRLRIGYLSADFRAHATAYLMAGIFEQHDRSRFETLALSIGEDDNSPMRARLSAGFDQFLDVRTLSDREIAAKLRELEIDILVDLKGYTKGARPGVLAHRAAPLQVSYLGYPGTMGTEAVDYLIADRVVIPEELREHYSEHVVWLPHSYQCNDDARARPKQASRQAAGLPASGFVFCSFNANYKIGPEAFNSWMRILAHVEGSVLWLLAPNATAKENLRREAERRGIRAERLIFAPHLDLEDHLARLSLADLVLDTWPYGAHTTASDALWMGVPVITVLGTSFAGRVAGSLIFAIGLPELVAESSAAYEALAVALARDPAGLAAVKTRLADNRITQPLFDTTRFTRDLEAAYVRMWEGQRQGLPPADFSVSEDG